MDSKLYLESHNAVRVRRDVRCFTNGRLATVQVYGRAVCLVVAVMFLTSCSPEADLPPPNDAVVTNEGESSSNSELETSTEPVLTNPADAARDSFVAARLKMAEGDFDAAVNNFSKAVELQPDDRNYMHSLADAQFTKGNFNAAIESYDAIIALRPERSSHLWQRGLALYYAGEFAAGIEQFEDHQTVNTQDVENAVWHLLCAARVEGLETARKNLIPIQHDPRVPMDEIYEMFAGRMEPEQVLEAAGAPTRTEMEANSRTYYANLYIGLFYELTDEPGKCSEHVRIAAEASPFDNEILMGQIAQIHLGREGSTTDD